MHYRLHGTKNPKQAHKQTKTYCIDFRQSHSCCEAVSLVVSLSVEEAPEDGDGGGVSHGVGALGDGDITAHKGGAWYPIVRGGWREGLAVDAQSRFLSFVYDEHEVVVVGPQGILGGTEGVIGAVLFCGGNDHHRGVRLLPAALLGLDELNDHDGFVGDDLTISLGGDELLHHVTGPGDGERGTVTARNGHSGVVFAGDEFEVVTNGSFGDGDGSEVFTPGVDREHLLHQVIRRTSSSDVSFPVSGENWHGFAGFDVTSCQVAIGD